jgi:hypothetical protein
MIHITEEGGRKKVGLNLYRTRGGFVVAWVWYYTATHELKGGRFRLRMHMKPRILWSVVQKYNIAPPIPDREEADDYLRKQLHIQQMEIDRLNYIINQLRQEKEAYYNAYAALLNHNISKSPIREDDYEQ